MNPFKVNPVKKLSILLALGILSANSVTAKYLFVSVDGNDSNPGYIKGIKTSVKSPNML